MKDLHIAILINNVCKSHDIPIPFMETTEKEMDKIITIDVSGTLEVFKWRLRARPPERESRS